MLTSTTGLDTPTVLRWIDEQGCASSVTLAERFGCSAITAGAWLRNAMGRGEVIRSWRGIYGIANLGRERAR